MDMYYAGGEVGWFVEVVTVVCAVLGCIVGCVFNRRVTSAGQHGCYLCCRCCKGFNCPRCNNCKACIGTCYRADMVHAHVQVHRTDVLLQPIEWRDAGVQENVIALVFYLLACLLHFAAMVLVAVICRW